MDLELIEEDVKIQDLNLVYKTLGVRGNEGERWKEYTEHVSNTALRGLSEFLNKLSVNRVVFRPYGSAAEDLKCQEPFDFGDLDIVIFPKSENLTIDDEMIEYLPEHPIHVRIKGAHHPVLQSCLLEGTEYVGTSALKNFHSTIFGSLSPVVVDIISHSLQLLSNVQLSSALHCSCHLKNSTSSPAVTVDFAQSFGSISEQLEVRRNNPENVTRMDANSWEGLIYSIFKTQVVEYTREHAKILDEILHLVNDKEASLSRLGLSGEPQMFPTVLQEIVSSDRFRDIITRFRDIERQSESGSRIVIKESNSTRCLPSSSESRVTPQLNSGEIQGYSGEFEYTFNQLAANQMLPEGLEPTLKLAIQNPPRLSDQSTYKEESCLAREEPGEATANSHQVSNDDKDNLVKQLEKSKAIRQQWFQHLFRKATDGEEACTTEKVQYHQRAGGLDFVPAFQSEGWPKVAQEWISRQRKWPSHDMVDRVIQEGFHLVAKPPQNGGNPACDFRISFSHAEYLLSQEMNDTQRECYRCLKKFHRAYLSTEPKYLVSFHLKNLFLHTIEETGAEMWTESNRAKCMMTLFSKLFEALTKKHLSHFFVRSYNLFCADYIKNPEVLEPLAEKVNQIVENPFHFAKELIQNHGSQDTTGVGKEERVPSNEPAAGAESNTDEGHAAETPEEATSDQKKPEVAKETKPTHKESIYRFHDLKDNFLIVSKELTDMALNDNVSLDELDPQERSLVENLRDIGRSQSITTESFLRMFDSAWDAVYFKVWMSSEPNIRRRVLGGIQGVVELMKYIVRQSDFGQPGGEDAILERLNGPTVEDPFDINHVYPAGIGTEILLRFMENIEPRPAQPRGVGMDDIPLD